MEQLASGVNPYEVVCKDELLLVERSFNKIACVTERLSQIMNWNVVNNHKTQTGVDKQVYYNYTNTPDLQKSKPIAKISADNSIDIDPLAEIRTYNNSISFPNKIQINESFTINYEWTSTGFGLTKRFALYPDKYMPEGSNVTIRLPPWVEFVDNVNYEKSDECSNFVHGKFDLNTINTSTQFGNFSVKYTKQPSNSYVVAAITFGDGGSTVVVESQNPQFRNNTNGTIYLYQSSYDEDPDRRSDYKQNVKCLRVEKSITNASITGSTQLNSIDMKPDCITKYQWGWLTDIEKDAILTNSTTCTTVNDTIITNVPYDWHRVKYIDFEQEAEHFDTLKREGIIEQSFNLEKYYHDQGIYQDWVYDFISYYEGITTQ